MLSTFHLYAVFLLQCCVQAGNLTREAKDLVYEAMKMRTGVWKPWDRDRVEIVGGGILEKKMLATLNGGVEDREGMFHESREMQCCDDLSLESFGGVLECHPYAIGDYKKIGACTGRSFYQHKNNTDIFLYYACGAWYVGLEIGVCGGWILAKSTEICGSARHESPWKYFNNGILEEDPTFQVLERCTFQNDFFPIPTKPTMAPNYWPPQQNHAQAQRPQTSSQDYPMEYPQQIPQFVPTLQPSYTPSSSSIKHEHFHYHYPTKDNYNSGSHPESDTNGVLASRQGLITIQSFQQNQQRQQQQQQQQYPQASTYVYSPPLQMSNNVGKYKYQYRGDPYKKRADDASRDYTSYFPTGRSETAVEDFEEEESTDAPNEVASEFDKNSRKME